MQSTWYVHTNQFLELVHYTLNFTQYVFEQEFTESVCKKEVIALGHVCTWPDWHQGVSSLYGSELAINHVFCAGQNDTSRLNNAWKSTFLDSNSWSEVRDTVQFHLLMMKHNLFPDIERVGNFQQLRELCRKFRRRLSMDLKGRSLEELKTNDEYAFYFFSQTLKIACRTFLN
ncbi:hypothetical protein RFI_32962 [Reticulomyxa filosa]|uniref:DUF7164 domain-containing protein n=1 Tax=Reticulomyxa filosa TaxID=46433 RepID=X6LSV4_RETFI|nr:hypothetical protein RFI_32962 [Reticulomyxa filosa]|eukprot:ETO04436.1 hypothetical protein RFI_32962 [Reticulomyxa filosa]